MNKVLCISALVLCGMGCGSESSIWEAAEQGDIQAVEEHLNAGTSVNAKGERTWMEATPLHHAVKGDHLNVVELLIENGADVNAMGEKTPLGSSVTPLDIAMESENDAVAKLLREHGAKLSSEIAED